MAARKPIRVDPEEWEALCALRDGEHARVQLRAIDMEHHYKTCLAINKDQCTRLNLQDLELSDLRQRLVDLTHKLASTETRLRSLEPARSETEQPLFASTVSARRKS